MNAANTGRYWYNSPIVRWDHNFSEKNKFYALFSEYHGYEFRSTNTFPKPVAQGNIDNNRTFTGLNLDDTHVLSPTMVLDVKASFFRFVQLTPRLLRPGARDFGAVDRHDQYDSRADGAGFGDPQHHDRRLHRHAVR